MFIWRNALFTRVILIQINVEQVLLVGFKHFNTKSHPFTGIHQDQREGHRNIPSDEAATIPADRIASAVPTGYHQGDGGNHQNRATAGGPLDGGTEVNRVPV